MMLSFKPEATDVAGEYKCVIKEKESGAVKFVAPLTLTVSCFETYIYIIYCCISINRNRLFFIYNCIYIYTKVHKKNPQIRTLAIFLGIYILDLPNYF